MLSLILRVLPNKIKLLTSLLHYLWKIRLSISGCENIKVPLYNTYCLNKRACGSGPSWCVGGRCSGGFLREMARKSGPVPPGCDVHRWKRSHLTLGSN